MIGAPIELLGRVELLSELDQRQLKELAGSMRNRRYAPAQDVVVEGEGGVGFFVIEEGTAAVTIDGTEVRTLGPGDSFGEIALVADTKRTATVTARTDLTCWGLSSWAFRPIVAANPALASRLQRQNERLLAER
jgi:CRP-like cAMP-binding protein